MGEWLGVHAQYWAGFPSTARKPKTSNVSFTKLDLVFFLSVFFPLAYAKVHSELQGTLSRQDDRDGRGDSFSQHRNRIPSQSNLKKEAFILAHSLRVQPIEVEKAWRQECEVAVILPLQA